MSTCTYMYHICWSISCSYSTYSCMLLLSRVHLTLQIASLRAFRRINPIDYSHAHMGGVTYNVETCMLCACMLEDGKADELLKL